MFKMAIDKTKNTQVLVTIPNEILKKIDDYQFGNRIKNRNEAIRNLISRGLENESKK